MANWQDSETDQSTGYLQVLTNLKQRDIDAATEFVSTPSNQPTGAIRYLRSDNKLQEWSGSAWEDKVLSIAGGGTGAASVSGIITALGLGTLAFQNNNGVNITGGTIAGVTVSGSTLSGTIGVLNSGTISATTISNSSISNPTLTGGTLYNVTAIAVGVATPADSLSRVHVHQPTAGQAVRIQLTNAATGATAGDGFHIDLESSGNAIISNLENASLDFRTSAAVRLSIAGGGAVTANGIWTFATNAASFSAGWGSSVGCSIVSNVGDAVALYLRGRSSDNLAQLKFLDFSAGDLYGTITSSSTGISFASGPTNIAIFHATGLGQFLTPIQVKCNDTFAPGTGLFIDGRASDNIGLIRMRSSDGTVDQFSIQAQSGSTLLFVATAQVMSLFTTGMNSLVRHAFADGGPGVPSITFTNELTLGFYRESATVIRGTGSLFLSGAFSCTSLSTTGTISVLGSGGIGIVPVFSDGSISCGASGARWSTVWAANGTIQTSDLNFKKDVLDCDLGLDFIRKLRSVSYRWKDHDNGRHYGLIAQEFVAALEGREFAGLQGEDGSYGLNYSELIPLMIKAIQELDKKWPGASVMP